MRQEFLYQTEWQQASKGRTRLDLAFSRDQAEKVYVQQRRMTRPAELYAWLRERRACLCLARWRWAGTCMPRCWT